MTSDGKRSVQPKRNEWGYPDTYDGDKFDDQNPPGGGSDIPADSLMKGSIPVLPKLDPNADVTTTVNYLTGTVLPALIERGVVNEAQ